MDFEFIDSYLLLWDRFAQGDNSPIPKIRNGRARFEAELAAGLAAKDSRSPSRFVFYLVVQVGGFVLFESALGQEFSKLDAGLPDPTVVRSKKMYFAGDIFFWWEKHKADFEEFALFEEWKKRDFAQGTAIPMYRSTVRQRQLPIDS